MDESEPRCDERDAGARALAHSRESVRIAGVHRDGAFRERDMARRERDEAEDARDEAEDARREAVMQLQEERDQHFLDNQRLGIELCAVTERENALKGVIERMIERYGQSVAVPDAAQL